MRHTYPSFPTRRSSQMGKNLARVAYSTEWRSPCACLVQTAMQKHPSRQVGKKSE